MKRIISLLLSLTFIFLLSSCNTKPNSKTDVAKTTKADSQEETEVSLEEQNLNKFFDYIGAPASLDPQGACDHGGWVRKIETGTDDILKHVVDCDGRFFITDDGSLYHLKLNDTFSDGTQYRKVKTNIKFVRFFDDLIIGEDNKLYYYDDDKFKVLPVDFSEPYYQNSKIWRALEKEKDYKKIFMIGTDDFCKVEGNSIYRWNNGKLLYTFPDDEKIEYFVDCTIKTNKGIYQFDKVCINEEEVDDYIAKPIYKRTAIPHELPFEYDFVCFINRTTDGPGVYLAIVDNYIYNARVV